MLIFINKGSRKKFSYFFNGPATKKKELFLKLEKKIPKNVAAKLEGEGVRP